MSFAHAKVSKGLMIGLGLGSLAASLLDVKYLLNLQLVPHLSRDHQYWRLFTHHFVCSNSSELFVSELLLYNVGVHLERVFGSVKFASFLVVSGLLSTILSFLSLIVFQQIGVNKVSAGPTAILLSLLYNYARVIPSTYQFKILSLSMSNKIFVYLLSSQLAVAQMPESLIITTVGLMAGQLYRSDIFGFKTYRLGPGIVSFFSRFISPLIGSSKPPRRPNRAIPEPDSATLFRAERLEPVTTQTTTRPQPTPENPSVMRQWVSELSGAGENAGGVRAPSADEINQLSSMFPDLDRQEIVGALQRSPNIEQAVESLIR